MTNTIKQSVLFADSARGIYIPQHFAESYNSEQWQAIAQSDLDILLSGPECENYWDVWQDVLDSAETICGGVLLDRGAAAGPWIVWPQLAIDAVNSECEWRLDYEENHRDAGDNYSHILAESWDSEQENGLIEQLKGPEVQGRDDPWSWIPAWDINPMGLEPEEIADIALDIFYMESGHMFSNMGSSFIVLDSYGVGEIEFDLEHLGIDGVTFDLIRESCDCYISGTGFGFMTSDSVWYAVVKPQELQQAIKDKVAEND